MSFLSTLTNWKPKDMFKDWKGKDYLLLFGGAYCAYFLTTFVGSTIIEKSRPYNASTTGEQLLKGKNLKGKCAIVTGANTGLGKETAKLLAKYGCTVIMACRNESKAENAKKDIMQELSSLNIQNLDENLKLMTLDLSSLESVRNFASEIASEASQIDFLINNAGIMAVPNYQETTDGFEMQFGVCHLGHYYLSMLLLGLLKRSKTRIINLSSSGHRLCSYNKTDELFKYCYDNKCFMGDMKDRYNPWTNYGIAKCCNILFTRKLNEEYGKDGIVACAVHPGAIATDLGRDLGLLGGLGMVFMMLGKPWYFATQLKNIEQGVATTMRCVTMSDEEIKNSLYCYYTNCCPTEPFYRTAARYGDSHMSDGLWQLSEALVKSKGFSLSLKEQ